MIFDVRMNKHRFRQSRLYLTKRAWREALRWAQSYGVDEPQMRNLITAGAITYYRGTWSVMDGLSIDEVMAAARVVASVEGRKVK